MVVVVLGSGRAAAQCPSVSLTQAKESAVIFDGTVLHMEPLDLGRIVTFTVHRIWKGTSHDRRISTFQWGMSEAMPLAVGARYLVFASPRTIGAEPRVAAAGVELEINDCASRRIENTQDWIRDLGPSRRPR
jgi:hypothetical protein